MIMYDFTDIFLCHNTICLTPPLSSTPLPPPSSPPPLPPPPLPLTPPLTPLPLTPLPVDQDEQSMETAYYLTETSSVTLRLNSIFQISKLIRFVHTIIPLVVVVLTLSLVVVVITPVCITSTLLVCSLI